MKLLRSNWGILLLVVFALGLRLATVTDRPIDGDEGVIALQASGSIEHVIEATAQDVHPPLYPLLVSRAIRLLGLSELSLRLVGVLAGVGLVALGPELAKKFSLPAPLLTLVLATSPFLVFVSQDARMYSLLILLALGSWLALFKLLEADSKNKRLQFSLLYFLCSILLVYCHHIGWLILGLEALALLLWHRQWLKNNWQVALGIVFGMLLAYLPLLPTTLAQVTGRLAEQSATASFLTSASGTIGAFYRFVAGRTFLNLNPSGLAALLKTDPLAFVAFAVSFLVPALLVLLGIRESWQRSKVWTREVIFLAGASLVVALVVGSVGSQASRYLSYLAPFILALTILPLVSYQKKGWAKAGTVLLGVIFLAGLWTQYAVHNQSAGLREYANYLRDNGSDGDVVLVKGAFAGGEKFALQYYQPNLPVVDMFSDYQVGNLAELKAVEPSQKANDLLSSFNRVWFFDNTYEKVDFAGDELKAKQVSLSQVDKEGQELTLWELTK